MTYTVCRCRKCLATNVVRKLEYKLTTRSSLSYPMFFNFTITVTFTGKQLLLDKITILVQGVGYYNFIFNSTFGSLQHNIMPCSFFTALFLHSCPAGAPNSAKFRGGGGRVAEGQPRIDKGGGGGGG